MDKLFKCVHDHDFRVKVEDFNKLLATKFLGLTNIREKLLATYKTIDGPKDFNK